MDLHIRPTLERLANSEGSRLIEIAIRCCVCGFPACHGPTYDMYVCVYSMYIYIFFLHEVAKHLILRVCVYHLYTVVP